MTQPSDSSTRRSFLKQGSLATGAAVLGSLPRNVFAADNQKIRLALIGCGGRGTGAVKDALSTPAGAQVELYAMADLYQDKIQEKYDSLNKKFKERINVPPERMFTGFQAYKEAIDSLRPGDVAMCTTRAFIRHVHVEYAVQKGINVFMEKPFASDPVGLQRLLRTAELSEQKGVKVMAGLQCRHSRARQALIEKIRNGEMGEIPLIRANRLGGGGWLGPQGDKALSVPEQIKFGRSQLLWIGSGHMVDNLIHQIDEVCWIKDSWPVSCVGMGGRTPGSTDCGQNVDQYAMEFTFEDGTKGMCGFRRQRRCRNEFATWIHGTKCAGQFSGQTHRATVHLFKDQRIGNDHIAWTPTKDSVSPWQYEWNDFTDAILNDKPFNEARRAVHADVASLMGRAAVHMGQTVTLEQVLNSKFQFCDYLDDLDFDSPVPVKPDENGQFEIPTPGKWKEV